MKRIVLTIAILLGMTFGMFAQSGSGTYAPIVLPPHGQLDDQDASISASTQTIALSSGWNWVSFNVDITMADLKAALAAAAPGTQIVIKSKDNQQATYNPTANIWVGQLNTLDLTQMYRVKVTTACQAELVGFPIDLASMPITIKKGANWICFPVNATMTLQNAFAGFAADGDKVKSKDNKQATYNAANDLWIGQLKNLEPGNGYIFTSSQTADRTLTFPSAK